MSDGDRVLLVSFPKSGSNWVRYCIEHFSGQRTPGSKRKLLVEQGDTVIDRTHFLDKRDRALLHEHSRGGPARKPFVAKRRPGTAWVKDLLKRRQAERIVRERRVLLIQRSPFELYARLGAYRPLALSGLFRNVALFDRCRREGCLVYYEDLVADFAEMGRILDFIGIEHDLAGFDVELHRQRSLTLYGQQPNKPQTGGDPELTEYHARDMRQEERDALRRFGQEMLGKELYARYLGRYDSVAKPQSERTATA